MFNQVKINCLEESGDYMTFSWEPNCTDGNPAGIDMTKSTDGSISMSMESLVKLRDACNEAIESNS